MTHTELRELADRATPGPWSDGNGHVLDGRDIPLAECFDELGRQGNSQQNAAYIAACSPEVVKALIAVAEAAEARRERDDSRLRLWLAVGECGHQDGEACPELEAIAVDDPSEEGRISGALRDALDALKAALA